MSKIKLTDEEKVIKELFERIVDKKISPEIMKKTLVKYCDDYAKASVLNTKFENEKIVIMEEEENSIAGSMYTARNGFKSELSINFDKIIKKYNINSINSNKRFKAAVNLVNILNHEMEHYFQGKEIENYIPNTKAMTLSDCLKITLENVARKTDEERFYSRKKGNYKDLYIEGDARRVGALKTSTQLFRIFPNMSKGRIKYLQNKIINSIGEDNVEFNELSFDSISNKHNRYRVTSAYVNEIVAAHPSILEDKKYKMLNIEYEKDGSRHTFEEILNLEKEVLSQIKDNKRINEDTRENLYNQAKAGYSLALFNSLNCMSKEYFIELRRRFGDKRVLKELDNVIEGQKLFVEETKRKYSEYSDFIENNKEKLSKKLSNKSYDELKKLYIKAGINESINKETGKKEIYFETPEIELINKFKTKIEVTYNEYPQYTTREEFRISNETIKKLKEENRRYSLNKYNKRKERQRKERVKEQEETRLAREELYKKHQQKMRNPLYRVTYNIRKIIENSKKAKLPSTQKNFDKKILEEKRDEVEKLTTTKNELQERYNNIKLESEDILRKAESKLIAENKEKKVEEKDIGKQI